MVRNLRILLSSLLLIAVITAVYSPGLSGGFIFDDFPHIVDNQALKITDYSAADLWRATLSSQAGPLKRPVAMFTLALNHLHAGLNPRPYLMTNLAIHVINSLLLTWLSFLLLQVISRRSPTERHTRQNAFVAFAVGLLWGLHPYNLTSVLYVIQRMNSLATLFSLAAIIIYAYFRLNESGKLKQQILLLNGCVISGMLAILSKENALLLPLQIAVIEFALLGQLKGPWRYWIQIRKSVFWVLVISIPAFFLYHLTTTDWAVAYHYRHFSLAERWMTEQRVLWSYLQQIFLPNITTMGLFLDDFNISRNWLAPATTFPALLGHIGLITLALLGIRKYPVLSFAILWFYTSHLLESTIFPLEIMFEHRNYFASIGPIFAVVYYLTHEKLSLKIKKIFSVFLALMAVAYASSTIVRATYFGDWISYPIYEAEHHPTSNRANHNAGRILAVLMHDEADATKKNLYFERSLKYFAKSADNNQEAIEPLVAQAQLYLLAGKEVPRALFTELESRLLNSAPGNDGYYIFKGVLEIARLGFPKLMPVADIHALFEAGLRNPKLTGQNRGFALMNYAIFQCNLLDNCPGSVKFARQAVEAAPGYTEFKLILSSFLYNTGNPGEGLYWLQRVQEQDKLGYYADAVQLLQQGATIHWGVEKRQIQH